MAKKKITLEKGLERENKRGGGGGRGGGVIRAFNEEKRL